MKTTNAKSWILAMIAGALLTLVLQVIWKSMGQRTGKQSVEPTGAASETMTPLQFRDSQAGVTLQKSRNMLRWERLPSQKEAVNQGVREEAQSSAVFRFRDAIRLVGEFSDDIEDTTSIMANAFSSGDEMIVANSGRSIARIAIRASAKRGERATLEPRFFPIWDNKFNTFGHYFIEVFLDEQPAGYLDTVSDWLAWLTHDEQLPATIMFGEGKGTISSRIYVNLKIIVALENRPEEHLRMGAAAALAKLKLRYANDAGFPKMLEWFDEIRANAKRKIEDSQR